MTLRSARLWRPGFGPCAFCLLLALPMGLRAADDSEDRQSLVVKRQQQEQLRAQTDQMARRMETMIRVLAHQQLDATEQNRVLQETVATLKGLSKDQMTAVIARLDEAAHAADKQRLTGALNEAYTGHREIVAKMKDLLARYDALHNLDDAAEQLERVAREELELQLLTAHVLERLRGEQSAESSTTGTVAKTFEALRQPDLQIGVRNRMQKLQRDLTTLEPTLDGDELLRTRQVLALSAELALDNKFGELIPKLRGYVQHAPADQITRLTEALASERKLVDELRQLATAARPRTDVPIQCIAADKSSIGILCAMRKRGS